MALQPVPDPPSEDSVGSADRSELDAMASLVANEARLHPLPTAPAAATQSADTPQFVMIDRSRASASAPTPVPRRTVAGWYPDDDDPGLLRYWDGHHLTGQTMRVDPETTVTTDQPAPPPPARVGAVRRPAVIAESWTTLRTEDGLSAAPEGPASTRPAAPEAPTSARPADSREAAVGDTPVRQAPAERRETADRRAPKDTPELWVDKVVAAVSRAQAAGRSEGWHQVASVAAVLSDLAETMAVAASAAQVSAEAGRAAEEARKAADAAVGAAESARRAEREAAEQARRAEDAARAAAEAAAEAEEVARTAEREAPEMTAAAEAAAEEAAASQATAEGIAQIVADARATDTPASWTEAHRLAVAALAS